VTTSGRDATLHILGPGDVFGEVALFHADGRTAPSELGELVDSSRQTVNRELRRWHDEGVLCTEDGRLVVLDLERLRVEAQ
jgi:CRP-like cAMP-binding protein